MKRFLICIFLYFCAQAATAAPIRVQTGEHPQFTRMVFRIASGTEWTLGRVQTGYMLRLPEDEEYDLRGFFDRIPKDRIAQISQPRAGELVFAVPCECRAEGFLVDDDVLVIDISDGPPLQNSRFEDRLDTDTLSSQWVEQPYTLSSLPILPQTSLSRHVPLTQPENDMPAAAVSERTDAMTDADLDALEMSISQSLATGLTQGVLATGHRDTRELPGVNDALREELRVSHAAIPGITTRTNLDILAIPENPQILETQSGKQCLPPSYFAVADWADDRSFSDQLSDARRDVFTERDRTDEAAVMRLARFFVFFGFGQEAVQTLDLDGVHSQERMYLAEIAHIVDGDDKQSDIFDEEVSCESPAALWAVLANQDGPMDAQVNRAAVLGAFKALPAHLQRYIGPRLSARFVAIGDHDGALQVLDVGRDDSIKTLDATLAEASLDQAMGAQDAATQTIVTTVRENARVTPEAMITYMEQAIENGSQIEPEDFLLADALRFENAHSPIARDLLEVQIRGQVLQNGFDQAAELISQGAEVLDPARVQALWDTFAAQAVVTMDDAAFSSFAFDTTPDQFSSDEREKIARRLVDLGFPTRADVFAPMRASMPTSQNPESAAQVESVSAHGEMPDQTQVSETDLVDWAQGNWEQLATSPDPVFQEASRAMLADGIDVSAQQPSLARGRELLSQSQVTRETLETILGRFPMPNDL